MSKSPKKYNRPKNNKWQTLEEKLEIIAMKESGKSFAQIARDTSSKRKMKLNHTRSMFYKKQL